jgi:signal transduction histidine kinase
VSASAGTRTFAVHDLGTRIIGPAIRAHAGSATLRHVWVHLGHRRFASWPGSKALLDVAIAVVALVGSLAQLSRGGLAGSPHESGELDWIGGLLAVCSTVPLVAWRRAPRAVFLLTASVSVLLAGLGYPLAIPLGPTVALYLLAQSREGEIWTRRSSGLVVALFSAYLVAAGLDGDFPGSELVHTGLAWAVAWFAGERTRLRRGEVAELRKRALRAERDAERERRLAASEERARIARDLHDAAGHAINVIAVRAGTARLRQDPERSQAALEAIEELARKTVAEIDQIVGTLRERDSGNGAVEAPPGLASLDALVTRHAAAGLDVSVATEGEPRRLERAVDQAAYRILQEALTNAARHGTGAARVELAFGPAALELTVSNPAAATSVPRSNGGHGLIGMRERATLLGGSLEVERANGSFSVRARLPYAGARV